jgi:hypothetical protein
MILQGFFVCELQIHIAADKLKCIYYTLFDFNKSIFLINLLTSLVN